MAVMEWVKKRLVDKRFPPSKAWLYLCIAATSDDKIGAVDLWNSYLTDGNEVVREVSEDLLSRASRLFNADPV